LALRLTPARAETRQSDRRADHAPASPPPRSGRGLISPLTRRILSVNILALAILAAGLLYLNRYEENLVAAELEILRNQGEIFAGALGQGAWRSRQDGNSELYPAVAGPMLRRLVTVTGARGRLYGPDGQLIADSRRLMGSDGGLVEIRDLPPPVDPAEMGGIAERFYEKLVSLLPGRRDLPRYAEPVDEETGGYPEVRRALAGENAHALRVDAAGHLVLTAAVPVQRFKKILGVVLLSSSGARIDEAVRDVRFDILKVFGAALGVTILLSFYLAGTIARPLRRLALAADRVRLSPGRERSIPGFQDRNDEIGDLAADLNAMTEALWQRLDAIESFAADVSHEIKNPLTSLRSAVETASRLDDPVQQKKLMGIIQDDVQRLDRLITDISAASRLDAELSREERARLDLAKLLGALIRIYETSGAEKHAMPEFHGPADGSAFVLGEEGRLVQVFQNLLTNAFSFAPVDGTVTLTVAVEGARVVVSVEDNGPGIPEGSLDRIFERFYSERPETERFGTHSGLGLSISRQIVEAHGGEIRAENRIGPGGAVAGARFVVRLPRA